MDRNWAFPCSESEPSGPDAVNREESMALDPAVKRFGVYRTIMAILALASILGFLAGCQIEKRHPPAKVRRLNQSDLSWASLHLARSEYQDLHYKVYRYDPAWQEYLPIRGAAFKGKLLVRPFDYLSALPDGSYTDGRFNLIEYFRTETVSGEFAQLSVAWTAAGDILVGVRYSRVRAIVRFLAIKEKSGIISVISDLQDLEALYCIDEGVRRFSWQSLLECLKLVPPNVGSRSFGEYLEWRNDPDCSEKFGGPGGPGGPALDLPPPPASVKDKRISAEAMRQAGVSLEINGETKAERNYGFALDSEGVELASLADAQEERERLDNDPDSTAEELWDSAYAEQQARDDYRAAQERRRAAERELERQRSSGNESGRPIPGESQPEDPRCRGRRVDAKWGALLLNPEFCGELDRVACLLMRSDSVFAFTEGQCWSEGGKDDNRTLNCGTRDPELGPREHASNLGDRVCDESSTHHCWSDQVAPKNSSGKIQTSYISLTPLGPFLLGLCARGGCPDPVP